MGEEIKIFSEVVIRLNIPVDDENLRSLIGLYQSVNLAVGETAYDRINKYNILSTEFSVAVPKEERTPEYQERLDHYERQAELYTTWKEEIQTALWCLEKELRKILKERERKMQEPTPVPDEEGNA